MKFRNKKTGEIKEWDFISYFNTVCGKTYGQWECDLAEFIKNAEKFLDEWEDYEEPKEYWFINTEEGATIEKTSEMFETTDKERKEIGNYFETKEEAEKAVERLKAWKRLKDKGFKFEKWKRDPRYCGDYMIWGYDVLTSNDEDLDLLFGGKE